ncbi:Piwi domain-containing protein [Mycena rosella]|uniref:Piwi domain-containing protein n=1 Tax=Mycena rosella TaxID=1033263 RepID=A0AAD7E0X7_MYCRO|nr:Piwi domain-containing protein [Mycena rosella]
MSVNVSVVTNTFVIKSLPTKSYYQYDIIFGPDEKPPPPLKRQRLIHLLQTSANPKTFHPRAVYDGNKLMYASHLIPDGIYRVHGSNQQAPDDSRGWYDIKISRTRGKEVVPAHVNQLMIQGEATPETATAINLLQLLLCQAANLKNTHTKHAYFSPAGKLPIPGAPIEIWRGFYQAVRPTVGRMLVNVDTTVAAMYKSGPLMDVAMAVLDARDARQLTLRDANADDFKKLERFLKNKLINVEKNKSTKTIRGLVPGPVGRFQFNPSGTGPQTTIGAHYQAAHGIHLRYPDTIGVVTSGRSAPFKVVIPLELCTMQGGQLYKKKLPPHATASVVSFAAMRPAERLRTIRTGGGDLRSPVLEYAQSEFMQEAGMYVDPNAVTVPGRLLKVPALLYNQKRVDPRDGAWNVLGSRFYTPKKMLRWGVANFDTRNITQQTVNRTIQGLLDCCDKLGMCLFLVQDLYLLTCLQGWVGDPSSQSILAYPFTEILPPPVPAVRTGTGTPQSVKETIAQICRELGGADAVDIIIVLLAAKADDVRTFVKHFCDIELGVRSQCLREPKLQKANNQYFNNVALKLNARLGGANSLVESPVLKAVASKPFMIMGADVAHPGPGSNRPSVVSLVWSHDQHGAEYCATTRVQAPRTELIAELKQLVMNAIVMFGNKHKVTPASIYFYRDGVSDGEFAQVQDKEIKAIGEAIDEIWKVKGLEKAQVAKPKLTFIVVGKRHHISFFPPTDQDRVGDKTGNCRAGLVVDQGLAHPQFKDFYLQSHAAIKGTSRSGHYIVLKDDNFSGISQIQEFSFALCHIYAKATRSVSIPAPVYYADLACARGKFHIDPASNMDLEASTTTGGQDEEFDLERWQEAYKKIHDNVRASMYFL